MFYTSVPDPKAHSNKYSHPGFNERFTPNPPSYTPIKLQTNMTMSPQEEQISYTVSSTKRRLTVG